MPNIENLVIVESPAKAKTIGKFLGETFTVKSSFGHIRDLSKKKLGIDIDKNFAPEYVISSDKNKIVDELKKSAKEARVVWLASDEDREGEAIAWHLCEVLKLDPKKTKRIAFHEITKESIQRAIENPRAINLSLVNAQQARRVLDRLVGFEVSPILWKKVKPALSAGRVQSVAVRLIVEREREIINHKNETYYKAIGLFKGHAKFKAELNKRLDKEKDAMGFLEHCKTALFSISDISKKPAKKSPAPPFTTSTLQQEASRKLNFSVSQTMTIAQRLYEAGHITYMRTDSLNLSDLAINTAKKVIVKEFGEKYHQYRSYKTKTKGAQEAHEAIRPTFLEKHTISGNNNEQRLYDLIWKRTIASQMSDASLEKTTVTIDISNSPLKFIASGEVLLFDGFLKVYLESTDDESEDSTKELLPAL
ncbi:MAG TPA: type I DNA topoisomerase, partial [Tenuifilaceae bacterium]|nr:type I DNA topoisomerase [Tenuifilaceae bacterium]